jgi:hypothetical protein
VQIRAQTRYHIWASCIHGSLFLSTQDTNAEHLLIENSKENEDIFKNVLTKTGVEYFYHSNDTNKSIAIFRMTIPLKT